MNGQDISQSSCNIPGSASSSVTNNGTTSSLNRNPWPGDISDNIRAETMRTHAAALLGRQDPSLLNAQLELASPSAGAPGIPGMTGTFPYHQLPFGSPLLYNNNLLSTMQRLNEPVSTAAATGAGSVPASIGQQMRLLMPSVSLDQAHQHNKQYNPPFNPYPKDNSSSLKHSASSLGSDPVVKRKKLDDKQYSPPIGDDLKAHTMSTGGPHLPPPPSSGKGGGASAATAAAAAIPHRPDYFHKGSIIQLGDSKLKRIEDLQTSDFDSSANVSPNLSLDCSTVTKISRDNQRGTAFITFRVGGKHNDQVEATVEATVEHPFFVFDQGWSSVNPERTLNHYKLECQKLQINDRCISLTFKENDTKLTDTSKAGSASQK